METPAQTIQKASQQHKEPPHFSTTTPSQHNGGPAHNPLHPSNNVPLTVAHLNPIDYLQTLTILKDDTQYRAEHGLDTPSTTAAATTAAPATHQPFPPYNLPTTHVTATEPLVPEIRLPARQERSPTDQARDDELARRLLEIIRDDLNRPATPPNAVYVPRLERGLGGGRSG